MKTKLLLLLLLCPFCTKISAQSNDYSRWSLAVKGGVNYFRIKPDTGPDDYSIFQTYALNMGWNLPIVQVEYTVNPYFGIGLDFGNYTYNRYKLIGNTLDATFFGSINLSNLLAPTREGFWREGTFYANVGLGVARYSYALDNAEPSAHLSPVGTASFLFERNLGKCWSLILEGQYRIYTKEDLGGIATAVNDNDAAVVNVGVRYKFGAKNKIHTRNAEIKDYFSDLFTLTTIYVPIDNRTIEEEYIETENKPTVDEEKGKSDTDPTNKDVSAMKDDLKTLETELRNLNTLLSKANAASKKAKEVKLEDKLKTLETDLTNMNENDSSALSVKASFDDIFFETNSSKISSVSYRLLDNIAYVIKNNAMINHVKIYGHTDSTGDAEANEKLSFYRAIEVKQYLIKKGIPENNISVKGLGESNPVADNSTAEGRAKNRRVEFEFSK